MKHANLAQLSLTPGMEKQAFGWARAGIEGIKQIPKIMGAMSKKKGLDTGIKAMGGGGTKAWYNPGRMFGKTIPAKPGNTVVPDQIRQLGSVTNDLAKYRSTNPLAYGTAKTIQGAKAGLGTAGRVGMFGVPMYASGLATGGAEGFARGTEYGVSKGAEKLHQMNPMQHMMLGFGKMMNPNIVYDRMQGMADRTYKDSWQHGGLKKMLETYAMRNIMDKHNAAAAGERPSSHFMDTVRGIGSNIPLVGGAFGGSPGEEYRRQGIQDFVGEGVIPMLQRQMSQLPPAVQNNLNSTLAYFNNPDYTIHLNDLMQRMGAAPGADRFMQEAEMLKQKLAQQTN